MSFCQFILTALPQQWFSSYEYNQGSSNLRKKFGFHEIQLYM